MATKSEMSYRANKFPKFVSQALGKYGQSYRGDWNAQMYRLGDRELAAPDYKVGPEGEKRYAFTYSDFRFQQDYNLLSTTFEQAHDPLLMVKSLGLTGTQHQLYQEYDEPNIFKRGWEKLRGRDVSGRWENVGKSSVPKTLAFNYDAETFKTVLEFEREARTAFANSFFQ